MDAHFFFVDIVGLSNWLTSSTEDQVTKITALNSLIKLCNTFKSTKGNKKFVLPTGDGMVIGFITNNFAPLKLAIEIHKKLFQYNKGKKISDKIKIRIGIHSAPVLKFIDILNKENVWGEGIIIARRVMDLGDTDHILLSSKVAEELSQISMKYRKMLHKVWEGEIKHGFGLEVYSAYGNGFGNKKAPKLDKVKLEEYKKSDARKLKREIELLKAMKKELENQKLHEIALYKENITDGGPYSLAITALNSEISKIDVQILQKNLELK